LRPLRLRARWAFPIDRGPIRDAAILIGADGRIASIGPEASIPSPEDALALDLGESALLPGLVNTHTHLELTGFEGAGADLEFRDWIATIRQLKERRSPARFLEAARTGIRDCWAAGVTTIADTGDSGAVIQALAELGGSGIVYQEVFGPHPAQLENSMSGLSERVNALLPFCGERVRLGVSPHAPYTVSGPLYSRVAELARRRGLPLAVHVAESQAETDFVTRGTGPFAEAWKKRGIPPLSDPSHQTGARSPVRQSAPSPVAWLDQNEVLGPDTLCIHAIQITAADIRTLASRAVAVAHCPLSNARHGHGDAPVGALRHAGVRVGLGTDSVASVGSLDLLAEARAARALAGLGAEESLAMATIEGARALGLETRIGTLTPGKWGDVIAISLREGAPGSESETAECVLASRPADTLLTVLGGRVVHRRDGAA
jgi:cytosine/adenosine deaminase-related metal-dependent hydrolase